MHVNGLDRSTVWKMTLFLSTPYTFPLLPTFFAARKTSNPAPLPRSMTDSPYICWLIHVLFPELLTGAEATYFLYVRDGERITAAQA